MSGLPSQNVLLRNFSSGLHHLPGRWRKVECRSGEDKSYQKDLEQGEPTPSRQLLENSLGFPAQPHFISREVSESFFLLWF